MQNLREELKYNEGYLKCLSDLMEYLKIKTNLTKMSVDATEILEEFISTKTEINDANLKRLMSLIPNKN